jgi:hypothetical protein
VAERGELVAGDAIAQLRLIAEREQCLFAVRRRAGARDRQHLLGRQIAVSLRRGGWAKVQ